MGRAVITGIGIVGPTGLGPDRFWEVVSAGRSVIGPVTRFDATGFPSRIAGEVPGREYEEFVHPRRLRRMPLVSRFAVAATRMALADAGHSGRWSRPERVGVVIGTSLGGYKEGAEQTLILHERGLSRVNPFLTLSSYYHSTAGEVAIESNAQGINLTQSVGCPSGLCAVGLAAEMIARGEIDVCITGGAEAPVFPIVYAGMCQARELSTMNEEPAIASRPFDELHNGIVLSEGSCVLILESSEYAASRGAPIYGHVASYAIGSEAYEMYNIEPTGDGASRTLQLALRQAGLSPSDISYISAHGNSCPRWDRKETLIVKKAFGEFAPTIPITSIKGAIGHNFGAAGAFQIASVALSFKAGLIPPIANFHHPDPECDLLYVGGAARPAELMSCLISNFGYGGVNAFMVVTRD